MSVVDNKTVDGVALTDDKKVLFINNRPFRVKMMNINI